MVKKVLVVDDDPGVIYTVKHGLEGLDNNYQIYPGQGHIY